ncbi:beta-N-acetylhexosaminidase [Wenjunlia vitaminophila]|uniref:beta-N-acetylhexosaminidase n=1 Tax=Wenjunlia vitaminophila TaxID=76728 RepID=A0A0T6LNM6_WENVI|nr:beta-N-acetylhexosaminidase [Wenjunlia vitaminophila]KRV47706.1 beta-N-acetylhexosaminidase [Wenjunlia vitaminophila]
MHLLPVPRTAAAPTGGAVLLDRSTTVLTAPGTEDTGQWLRETVGRALGLPLLPGARGGRPPRNAVLLRTDPALPPEGYRLTVARDHGVEIAGGGPAGVFWGAQTLRQLLGPDAFRRAPVRPVGPSSLPGVTIEDAPRFPWRGTLLDVARHFVPKDGVLRWIDLMAAHKLNVLHLHLTDDQGWRMEVLRHPGLTEVGGWRERSMVGHRSGRRWDERPHGGYYTQADLREIVAYAALRHITVVPEIDLPGHCQAAIAAYPELGNRDVLDTAALGVWTDWGISENVLAPTPRVLDFFQDVLTEVLEVFPSVHVHLGGDECPKDQWRRSATARARAAELGLADEAELQGWMVRHFADWLAARGRRLVGWDEILDGTAGALRRDVTIASWRGAEHGVAAARAGHDVVMCPEEEVYLDHRQDEGPDEPIPVGYLRTLQDVHRFEPVPPGLTPDEARHVIGVQANVWTEMMDSVRAVDYMAFPRLCAFSEVAWSDLGPAGERDFAAFTARMSEHYRRLDALGVEYRPPSGPRPWQRRPGVAGHPRQRPPIV